VPALLPGLSVNWPAGLEEILLKDSGARIVLADLIFFTGKRILFLRLRELSKLLDCFLSCLSAEFPILFYFILLILLYFTFFSFFFLSLSRKQESFKVRQDFISLKKRFLSAQGMFHGTILFYCLHA
jgi:hypothetical protein